MLAKINLDGEDRLAVVFPPFPATSFDDVCELRKSLLSLVATQTDEFLQSNTIAPVLDFVAELDSNFYALNNYYGWGKGTNKATVKDCKITI